ncbi:Hypothetical predicted protein [Podarcis lilfordi]|uniref:Uncharacterized protein n=1 Tax=Podarcis lilfordi TaxID=74358 RepID=A0AA35KCQ7_9SAUR|nr:Hypothetical predicted protein [Podarcis lilfordi]
MGGGKQIQYFCVQKEGGEWGFMFWRRRRPTRACERRGGGSGGGGSDDGRLAGPSLANSPPLGPGHCGASAPQASPAAAARPAPPSSAVGGAAAPASQPEQPRRQEGNTKARALPRSEGRENCENNIQVKRIIQIEA